MSDNLVIMTEQEYEAFYRLLPEVQGAKPVTQLTSLNLVNILEKL